MEALPGRSFLVMILVMILWEELQLATTEPREEMVRNKMKKVFVNNTYLRKFQGIKPFLGDI
tara:strand:- start:1103 stop:1288 length:186 start_codon:yes stop_codon:yes gene_type:complete